MHKPAVVIGYSNNELLPTHPIHNIPPKSVMNAYIFFQSNTNEASELDASEEIDEDDDDEDDEVET